MPQHDLKAGIYSAYVIDDDDEKPGVVESSVSKKEQVYIPMIVTDVKDDDGEFVQLADEVRIDLYLPLSGDAFEYTVKKLDAIGWNGDFGHMLFGDDAYSPGIDVSLRYEEYKGKERERWDIWIEFEKTYVEGSKLSDLNRRAAKLLQKRDGGSKAKREAAKASVETPDEPDAPKRRRSRKKAESEPEPETETESEAIAEAVDNDPDMPPPSRKKRKSGSKKKSKKADKKDALADDDPAVPLEDVKDKKTAWAFWLQFGDPDLDQWNEAIEEQMNGADKDEDDFDGEDWNAVASACPEMPF